MTRSILKTAAICGVAMAAGLAAPVAAAVTISGAVNSVTVGTSDPGLVINATPLAFPTFTLNNVGDFRDFNVLTIGTAENSVDFPDDFTPLPVSVAFRFTSPGGATGAPITGNSVGFYDLALFGTCGVFAGGCGSVTFNAPTVFNFSNGGRFSVALSNATFATPGTANINGRFTLLAAPVPEPSTWALMLLGFGAVGAAMRAPKRRRVAMTYA